MISLGTDLVAGKKRVPNPATGNIAFVTFDFIGVSFFDLGLRGDYDVSNREFHFTHFYGTLQSLRGLSAKYRRNILKPQMVIDHVSAGQAFEAEGAG